MQLYNKLLIYTTDEPQREMNVLANRDEDLSETIIRLHPEMEKYIVIAELLPYLSRHKVLTKLEREKLGPISTDPPTIKTRNLLSFLESKDPDSVGNFVRALYESSHISGHKHLVKLLKNNNVIIELSTKV